MKKVVLTIMLCAVFNIVTFSQTDESKKSDFQLSLIPPVSTNGQHSAEYTNTYSINILVGISKNEEKLAIGGFSNVILNDAKGVQAAGVFNYAGNEGQGFQWAGMANMNKGKFSGVQLAGLINTAANVTGVQFSGLINIAKDVRGAQFAGLINIAENSDCPIGLINIIKNGEMGIAITYDGTGNTIVSFRSGGKYTYGILGVGYNHKMSSSKKVIETGLGAHIPVTKWLRINNEVKTLHIGCDLNEPVYNVSYSLLPAFRIGNHVEFFGGASINYMESNNLSARKIFPNHSLWKNNSSTKQQQLYVGWQAGFQYIF